MNEKRFLALLAAYGSDLARWPAAERVAAEDFLAVGPHRVRDVWESERTFDRLLALEADAPASLTLETRVLAAAPSARPRRTQTAAAAGAWARLKHWAAGGAVAASLAVGFAAGYGGETPRAPEAAQLDALARTGAGALFFNADADGDEYRAGGAGG
jgi:hypothetical protein